MNIRYIMGWIIGALCMSNCTSPSIYICPPCELPCDSLTFSSPGKCPHCGMTLIQSINPKTGNKVTAGSGTFFIPSSTGRERDQIEVFYYLPKSFSPDSKVLIVVPGAGRNGDSYRDAWIEEADQYDVIILSPRYPQESYPFEAYHLGGVIRKSNLADCLNYVDGTNQAQLDESKWTFEIEDDPNDWIFNDFDRMVQSALDSMGLDMRSYDLFGHSAGGHILHRLALLRSSEKVDRIIAANASFYTLPDKEIPYPFGLSGLPSSDLKAAFAKKLVILLGQEDNAEETGGTILRSASADQQGFHRLERGQYFYERSKAIADSLGFTFNWRLEIVPGVGHNHRLMGDATADLLYHPTLRLVFPEPFYHDEIRTVNGIAFTQDGQTIYTSMSVQDTFDNGKNKAALYVQNYSDGTWSAPRKIDFGMHLDAYHPVLSTDNSTMFFNSRSDHSDSDSDSDKEIKHDIWMVEKNKKGWNKPQPLTEINSDSYDSYPSVDANGNLYFNSDRPGGRGSMDFYVSKRINDRYSTPENIAVLNSVDTENDLVVDPEERFIIFNRYLFDTKEVDMYISHNRDGNWQEPAPLDKLNRSGVWELTPSLSPDLHYFYYELDQKVMRVPLAELINPSGSK